jgi:hypothetical protein
MAGGDLLYIFAFIILPTAVLVSCIWALIMLRNGRLLPQRPMPRDYELDKSLEDETDHARDPIEETGEHVLIEPIQPAAVAPAAPTAGPDDRSAPIPTPVVAEASDVPIVEQTQELSAVPVEAAADDLPAGVTDLPAAPSPAAADVLMVPLEEPAPRYSNGRTEPPAAAEVAHATADVEPEAAEVEPVAAAAPEPQRPARRPVRLHPSEPDPARPRPRIGQR